jgi:FixJ family two-component response regulator
LDEEQASGIVVYDLTVIKNILKQYIEGNLSKQLCAEKLKIQNEICTRNRAVVYEKWKEATRNIVRIFEAIRTSIR